MQKKLANLLKCYQCSCRLTAGENIGSGTIVYSRDGSTYLLTNHHVISSCVTYKKVWDSVLKKEVKKEFTEAVEVLFPRLYDSTVVGYSTVLADIVAYDAPQDIALLRFRDRTQYPSVKLYPREKIDEIPFLAELACIGAALGQTPIVTFGNLNGRQIEIDNYEYWVSSAPSIFGNSGGGIFLFDEDTEEWWFIGIPSRISVVPLGFTSGVVTHMGYFVPPHRIYNFLDENMFQFIYDSNYTEEQCNRMRQEKRLRELMRVHPEE